MMGGNYAKGLYNDFVSLTEQNESLVKAYHLLKQEISQLRCKVEKLIAAKEKLTAELKDKDGEIEALKKEIARLTALHSIDGTNSGIPTAKTPIHNIECNVHLLRDLQKVTDNLGRSWSADLKEMLTNTNALRNEAIGKGEEGFAEEQVTAFFARFDELVIQGIEENEQADKGRYYIAEERALLKRLLKHKANYLAWVTNFDLPFSNNVSERALRIAKTKMKVTGQFKNCDTAKCYAGIRSYIETAYRNGLNVMEALKKLCQGNPLTVADIVKKAAEV